MRESQNLKGYSQTERHWVDRFEELADGHGTHIDYGSRESDMYDWNDRRN